MRRNILALDAPRTMFGRRFLKSSPAGREGVSFTDALVCQVMKATAHCVYIRRHKSEVRIDRVTVRSTEQGLRAVARLHRKSPIIAILSKSHYVVRTLEIPRVSQREASAILHLEAEAFLPPGFGPAEISYRQLPSEKEGLERYEVYASRRSALGTYLKSLTDLGLHPSLILPSAVIWSNTLASQEKAALLVAHSLDSGGEEVASLRDDGTVLVRTLKNSPAVEGFGMSRGLVEYIRSVLAHSPSGSLPLNVGWIGEGCPSSAMNGRVVFCDMTRLFARSSPELEEEPLAEPLVHVAALSLVGANAKELPRSANLLPRELVHQSTRHSVYKTLSLGVVSVLLGLALVCVALKIAILRYERLSANLAGRIALIETEGEAAGRRIAQLKAIRALVAADSDLFHVVSGLYEATPSGVTYSHVELTESREIRLRGQAESVSLPFLLPERLERLPMFGQVVLRSVGQRRTGGGSISEFRLECSLERVERE